MPSLFSSSNGIGRLVMQENEQSQKYVHKNNVLKISTI